MPRGMNWIVPVRARLPVRVVGCLTVLGGQAQGVAYAVGQTLGHSNSGKLRRKLVAVPGLQRIAARRVKAHYLAVPETPSAAS